MNRYTRTEPNLGLISRSVALSSVVYIPPQEKMFLVTRNVIWLQARQAHMTPTCTALYICCSLFFLISSQPILFQINTAQQNYKSSSTSHCNCYELLLNVSIKFYCMPHLSIQYHPEPLPWWWFLWFPSWKIRSPTWSLSAHLISSTFIWNLCC